MPDKPEGEGNLLTNIPPRPVPTQIIIDHQKIQGLRMNEETKQPEMAFQDFVVLISCTPQGVNFTYMEPDVADWAAETLKSHATQARTGLQVPGQGIERPNGSKVVPMKPPEQPNG